MGGTVPEAAAEQDNLRAALEWADATPDGSELVVALMGVSLPHLADESRRILHCSNAVAWLTAFTFDVSQLIAEVVLVFGGMLVLPRKVTMRLWAVIGGCYAADRMEGIEHFARSFP